MDLLTTGNPKIAKGEAYGIFTAVLHLAPHRMAGMGNVCTSSTAQCRAVCLDESGHAAIWAKSDTKYMDLPDGRRIRTNTVRRARIARTHLYFQDPDAFFTELVREMRAHIRAAARHGLVPAFRLNATSDVRWEDIPVGDAPNIFALFPEVQFYDYTKHADRMLRPMPSNYHLTLSFSGDNLDAARAALDNGRNVAVVFQVKAGTKVRPGDPLPATWNGYPVADADVTDLRFLDPRGHVAGLRAKGKAKKLPAGGFVQLGRAS